MRVGAIPIALTTCTTSALKTESRSRMRYFGGVERERLTHLLGDPCRSRVLGDVELNDLPMPVPDELADFDIHGRPTLAATPTGDPQPEEAEACAAPAHDRIGLDDDQRVTPLGPEPANDDPEGAVADADARPLAAGPERGELLFEHKVLDSQITARAEDVHQRAEAKTTRRSMATQDPRRG